VKRSPVLKRLKAGLEALYGPRLAQVVLFGSQARGEAGSHSDIDVLVVLKDDFERRLERARVLPLIVELSLETGELPSVRFADESRYAHGQDPLMLNVRREGVAL
jgi:predicted nucleotidyltransferase